MKPSEIIKFDAQKNGLNPNYFLKVVAKIVSDKLGIILQHNDTVLLVIRLGDGRAEVHIATADSPLRVLSALKYFFKKLSESEIHKIYLTSEPKDTLSVLKKLNLKIKQSDLKQYKVMIEK
jgi:hypothetical protein